MTFLVRRIQDRTPVLVAGPFERLTDAQTIRANLLEDDPHGLYEVADQKTGAVFSIAGVEVSAPARLSSDGTVEGEAPIDVVVHLVDHPVPLESVPTAEDLQL